MPILEKIEGLRSLEEIQKEREEKEAAEEKARIEKRNAPERKAKSLAKGYVYHGFSESTQNSKTFNNKALKKGHAYYIDNLFFDEYLGGDYAYAVISLFDKPSYQRIKYVNEDVRNEVLNEAGILGGFLPVSVIVVGGDDYLKIPVVLCLITEDKVKD
ncbi:hypothetical protein [Treponema pedis]|uniref:hypothetical protein n=1 Tax=Treponema pedis TaxID=409322 RepID=UPI00040A26D3|nr:hypothetical protein [Treponema pedis]